MMSNNSLEYAEYLLPCTIFVTTGGIIGFVGNVMAIIVYCFKIDDFDGNRYFIPILAFTDAIGCIVITAYNYIDNNFIFDYPSEELCRGLTFSIMISGFFSACLLMIISLQRYLIVCRPHVRQMTLGIRRCCVIVTVIVNLITMLPWVWISGTDTEDVQFQNRNITGTLCKIIEHAYLSHGDIYLLIITSFMFIIMVSMVVLYTSIGLQLHREFAVRDNQEDTILLEREREENNNVQTQFYMMFLIIVACYILAFLPTVVLLLIAYIKNVHYLNLPPRQLCTWILFGRFVIVNHFINPYVYTLFDPKYRIALKEVCACFHSHARDGRNMEAVPPN